MGIFDIDLSSPKSVNFVIIIIYYFRFEEAERTLREALRQSLNDKNVLQEIESLYLEKGKKTEANQVAIYTQSLKN